MMLARHQGVVSHNHSLAQIVLALIACFCALLFTGTAGKMWIVRSIMPQVVIEAMTQANADIAAETPDVNDAAGPSSQQAESDGRMLNWERSDGQVGSMGLTFLMLSLILLNGRSLPDGETSSGRHIRAIEVRADFTLSFFQTNFEHTCTVSALVRPLLFLWPFNPTLWQSPWSHLGNSHADVAKS